MWSRRLVAVALVLLVAAPLASTAAAQQTDKQRQLANDIDATNKATQQARDQAAQFQAEKTRLNATLGDLATQVSAAEATLASAQALVDHLTAESATLTEQIDKTQTKLTSALNDAKASAVLLYQRPDTFSSLNLLGSADGSGSIVEGQHYLHQVSAKRRRDLARAERLKATLQGQKDELHTQQDQADQARAQAETTKNQVAALYAQQQSARDAAARAQAGYDAQVATLTAQQNDLLDQQAVEDARVREALANAGNTPPLMGSGRFLRPVGNAPITSTFGYRTDPITGVTAFHSGIDFGAPCGTPIHAGGNGTVIFAGVNGGYGNATIINHGGGLSTLYGHQSAFAVSVGQVVTAGQVIGYVGSTGKSTGCHVHFEVRVNGNPVDPAGYL